MNHTSQPKRIVVLALWYAVCVACSRAPSEFTVDYYVKHDAEREQKLEACANDPGAMRNDALCINAQKAGSLKGIGSLRERPAMTLLEAQEQREQEISEAKAKEAQ